TAPRSLLDQALRAQATELAMHQLAPADVAADAEPHLAALTTWYQRQRQDLWASTPRVRVETFLLAPAIGLKGRLDALWEDEYTSQLLELKTSTVRGELPRREHRWQVYGYQALLASRRQGERERPRQATLLYSGTPGQAEAHSVHFELRELHRVLELRNLLALAHATDAVAPPPGERKCARCSIRANCLQASALLGWEPPPLDEQPLPLDPRDVAWFRQYYDLLRIEGRAAEQQGRLLWTTTPAERRGAGLAIGDLHLEGEPRATERGEWEYTFRCVNTSELREGDMVLLSDGDPIHGATVTGTLLAVTDRSVTLWTPEPIRQPALIDRYGSDIVHDRTVRNLWRWLGVAPRLRALARGELAPTFEATADQSEAAPGLNPEQRAAVARALAARDFLLIQGPPGTGKTRVVAEIVRQLVAQGKRVLVSAFTNQAVDNVLACLLDDGFDDFIRLGNELSVRPALRGYRLAASALAQCASGPAQTDGDAHGEPEPAQLRAALQRAPVVAATTATWAAERFDEGGQVLAFDVAIVDEASQLTVPAVVAALRFAERFILVGDGRQLPPLVVSPEAAERGLQQSLFSSLSERWGTAASITLTRQYRMHPVICEFPSQAFYAGVLTAAGAAQSQLLEFSAAVADGLDAVLDPRRPLVLVEVPSAADASLEAGRTSRAQARVVGRLVRGLRARGIVAERIGVIAPFRAQVAAIRQQLAHAGETEITVDTVDRFQGGERAVIVLSFGQALGFAHAGARGLLAASFVADPNRLNVALTRAQRKLIVVGDRTLLEGEPLLAALVQYAARLYGGQGGVVRADISRA
ncbi:MAG TPA: AAA domain-containing protein, partial [Ktedonobacterales bacterium]|nr:AAA domain-containing protein [Ktedonobacterales bacterium]